MGLPREDLDLIAELILKSASIKDLAASYSVSYPTIRSRLDKVIERLQKIVEGRKPDPLSDLLANLIERGEMTASTARTIRDMVRKMGGPT
jgi:hypothetical protein